MEIPLLKSLLNRGFFIVYKEKDKFITLENPKTNITIKIIDYGNEFLQTSFTKDLNIGSCGFINISYNTYSDFLNNYEKTLTFLENVNW